MTTRLETRDLTWRDIWPAARVLANAYQDGAIWAAAGEVSRWRKQTALTLLYLAELLIARWTNGFTMVSSHFANLASEADARSRALREISDDIRLQIGLHFAG